MKQLFAWTLVMFASWCLAYGINWAGLDTDLSWTLSLEGQKRQIASDLQGPRLILAGGSQTHYSVSADILEAATGCSALNYGLHAGLGLNAILDLTAGVWRRGDTVLLFPEYGILSDEAVGWLAPALGAAIGSPQLGARSPSQTVRNVVRAGRTSMHSLGKSLIVALFHVQGRASNDIGRRGDNLHFLVDIEPVPADELLKSVDPDILESLRSFRESAVEAGVELVFVLPIVFVDEAALPRVRREARETAESLGMIGPVVRFGDSYNLRLDRDWFSDTQFHASEYGRRLHTLELAEELRRIGTLICG